MSQIQTIELDIGPRPSVREVKLVFTNITPYYGGKHIPKTVYCLDENCSTIAYALPSVSSIKGVMRWLLRTILAYYVSPSELWNKGYRALEGGEGQSTRKMGLLEYLFGTTNEVEIKGKKKRGFSGVLGIYVEKIEVPNSPLYITWNDINNAFREMDELIHRLTSIYYKIIGNVKDKEVYKKLCDVLTEILFSDMVRQINNQLERERISSISGKLVKRLNKHLEKLRNEENKLKREGNRREADVVSTVSMKLQESYNDIKSVLLMEEKVVEHILKQLFKYNNYRRLFEIPRIRLLSQEIPVAVRKYLVWKLMENRDKCVTEENVVDAIGKAIQLIKKEFFILQPLREDSLKIHIRLVVSPRVINEGDIEDILKLGSLLLILSLAIIGVGKCVTRGFGRFRLVKVNTYGFEDKSFWNMLRDKGDDINWVIEHGLNIIHEVIRTMLDKLDIPSKPLVREPTATYVTPPPSNRELICIGATCTGRSQTRLPLLRIHILNSVKKPMIRKSNRGMTKIEWIECRDLLDILSAIGRACLKIYWKHVWFYSSRLQEGMRISRVKKLHEEAFHTIILGLPRSVGRTGYDVQAGSKNVEHWRSPIILFPWRYVDKYKLVIMGWFIRDLDKDEIKIQHMSKYGEKVLKNLSIMNIKVYYIEPTMEGECTAKQVTITWNIPQLINYAMDTIISILTKGERHE